MPLGSCADSVQVSFNLSKYRKTGIKYYVDDLEPGDNMEPLDAIRIVRRQRPGYLYSYRVQVFQVQYINFYDMEPWYAIRIMRRQRPG